MIAKSSRFRFLFIGIVILASATACLKENTQPKPDNLINENTYIDLMVEMQHLTTYKNAEPDSVNADSLINLVYERYGVTDQQYLSSHRFYQSQLQAQIVRIDSVLYRLENEQQMMQSYIDSLRRADNNRQDSMDIIVPDPSSMQL